MHRNDDVINVIYCKRANIYLILAKFTDHKPYIILALSVCITICWHCRSRFSTDFIFLHSAHTDDFTRWML